MDKRLKRILVRGGSISWQIIKLLAKAGVATAETIINSRTHRWASLHDYPRPAVYKATQRLKQYGYVKTSIKNGEAVFELTESVKKQLAVFEKLTLKYKSPMRWDKRWRLVSFDIPETQHKYRDKLRWKLKRLGLEKFQQSIWLSPYPLEDDFHQIIAEGGLQDCVLIIDTDRLPNESKWKSHFRLQ